MTNLWVIEEPWQQERLLAKDNDKNDNLIIYELNWSYKFKSYFIQMNFVIQYFIYFKQDM